MTFGLRDGAQVASLRCPILRADERRVHEIPDRVDGEPKGKRLLDGQARAHPLNEPRNQANRKGHK
jgi:hypothetical protein